MTDKPREVITKLAETLQGSAMSLADGCEVLGFTEDDMSVSDCEYLDTMVFNCECCGWWFEQSEMAKNADDQWICESCAE